MARGPLVRIVEASLGPDAQVRLVVSGVSEIGKLKSAWSSSGASLELVDDRIHAVSTVEALARAAGRALDREEARALDASLREAVAMWGGPAPAITARGRLLPLDARPLVMGVVNVTPDSFSDGGRYPHNHPQSSIDHARRLLEQGADLLDIGGESTRPGAPEVETEEELARVLPVIEGLVSRGALISIDTRKAVVAEAALRAGAVIVNDTSGAADPALLDVTARAGAAYVLMHSRGTPFDMQRQTEYGDVVAEVYEFLADRLDRCVAAGIRRDRILVDPGIGFAKTVEHNLALLGALRQLRGLARPVLVGASRKSFLGKPLGGGGPDQRLPGSLAVAALATASGAAVIRVHDVAETVQAIRAAYAVRTGSTEWPSNGR